MDEARWRKVEALYEAALALEPYRRAALLEESCGGDASLRSEVDSLLACASKAQDFLEAPVADVFPDATWQAVGQRVAHYEIQEKLGEGGMGVVYKARDTRLGRSVALKFVKAQFSERFEREARAIAALNHPHIATLYEVGEHEGAPYLAMEFIEGLPLTGPRPVKEVIEYGIQIADALAAAHAAGIVHRDLKPANILVTEKGSVKILDFGLAKLRAQAGDATPATTTLTGVSAGTPGYMSPEQIDGKPVDSRSDIFAFGCVLYELASGRHAFEGNSVGSVLAATVTSEPKPLDRVPPELNKLIRRCLRKELDRRFQNMSDVRVALAELKEESESSRLHGVNKPESKRPRRWLWAAIAAATVLVVATGVVWRLREASPPGDLSAVPLTTYSGVEQQPSFSPDGNKVAFTWNGEKEDNFDIYVKQIGSTGTPMRLTTSPAEEFSPAWSPDDRWIAFVRQQQGNVAIMLIPPLGGQERKLTEMISAAGLCWTPDAKWLAFSERDSGEQMSIWAISVETGERRRLTTFQTRLRTGEGGALGDYYPSISPDGRSLAFARNAIAGVWELYALQLTRDLRPAGEPARVTDQHYASVGGPAWTANGREIVYSAGSVLSQSLWRVPVSGRGTPQRLPYALPAAVDPAIARTSPRLIYTWSFRNANLWRLDTRAGERKMLIGSNYASGVPQYSPDGHKIAFQSNRSGDREVWTCDGDGANCQQLTFFGGPLCGTPRWSRDGRWLALDSYVEGQSEIYVIAADGGTPRRVTNSSPFSSTRPSWSRDGRWIYFSSDRTGRNEIWKTPAGGGQAVQVTRSGGATALESPDGKYIYYMKEPTPPGLFRMPVEGGEEKQVLPGIVYWADFGVTAKGVYFMPDRRTIQLLDTATGKVSTLATLDKPMGAGICVSPDDAYVVWAQVDRISRDLMLVEGFR